MSTKPYSGKQSSEQMKKQLDDRERLTVAEAGARGGRSTLERRGTEFFREIGKKGGQRTAELYREFLGEFGRRGGRPRRPSLDECQGEEGHIRKE